MKDNNHQYNNNSFFSKQSKEPLLNAPFIIVFLIAFCFCVYVVPQYFFSRSLYIKSLERFAFTPVLFKVEPLTFCHTMMSYSFMHSSFQHVAMNMAWLLVFGTPLVRHLGGLRFLIFWMFTAIIAVLTYFVFHQESEISLVGASGAVCGMMGALARYGFSRNSLRGITQNESFLSPLLPIKKALYSKRVLIFVSIWLSADFIMGISSILFAGDSAKIAWEAHIGGFFSGFLFIGFFDTSWKKLKTTL